ncbi:Mss4-like protein [Pelagophyceae sp. CCMP2097]|nr:Mss4-like protein [Pelagophyceae sp. CCMP2097]|mmetsp:Transcript_5049/g.17871  ORF Transcript_5049/g.17871 Transcript_5049/m.17871 type:complete len:182 (+) Transcript_5049:77-622(+)
MLMLRFGFFGGLLAQASMGLTLGGGRPAQCRRAVGGSGADGADGAEAGAEADVDAGGEGYLSPKSPLAGFILKGGGTEPAWTSDLNGERAAGVYVCAGCLTPLFASETKFDSGTGWPSFWAPASVEAVTVGGGLLSMVFGRECTCKSCGGHLGHRFDDGPRQKTGKRFCINGAALRFKGAA